MLHDLSAISVRARGLLTRMEEWLAAVSILLLIGLSLTQIVARNAFDAGFPGMEKLGRQLVLYVTFLGAALAVTLDRHIRIDIAAHWLNPRWRARLYRPFCLVSAVVCALFLDAALRFLQQAWLFSPVSERWLVLPGVIIPAGYLLLLVHFLLESVIGRATPLAQPP